MQIRMAEQPEAYNRENLIASYDYESKHGCPFECLILFDYLLQYDFLLPNLKWIGENIFKHVFPYAFTHKW